MNVEASVAALPDNIRRLVAAHPTVAERLEEGASLYEVLSSPAWAESWAAHADKLALVALRGLLLRFGANAFEAEKGEAEAVAKREMTGAEWRAAAAFLRRCGVIFAVRKTWGERLYYLPSDMVPVWQRILLPVRARPLPPECRGEVRRAPDPPRLPLPLEMLGVWARIRQKPVALTAKGAIAKPAAARLAQEVRLQPEELAPLGLVYPQREWMTPGVALALDLGLATGVLRKDGKEIGATPDGLSPRMGKSMAAVNAAFYRLVMERDASADPGLHLAASAVTALETGAWYEDGVLEACGICREAAQNWLRLLVAFGWAERGEWRGRGVFRLMPDLAGLADLGDRFSPYGGEACGEVGHGIGPEPEEERCIIQPDGEIWVPPEVSLTVRWFLEDIAERVTADRMFVYRLTRTSCAGAFARGRSEAEVRGRLEQYAGAPLPEPVSEAIAGWFRSFGRVRLVENAVLLRAESEETARRLLEDEDLASCLVEGIGERDFLVDGAKLGALKKRLTYLGYNAPVSRFGAAASADGRKDVTGAAALADGGKDKAGAKSKEAAWILSPARQLVILRPDEEADSREALYPGISRVPSAWLTRPGDYHPATRRKLIGLAIAWKAAVRVGKGGVGALFVPQSIVTRGERWEAKGYWRKENPGEAPDSPGVTAEPAALAAEEAAPLQIVLPALDPLA